MPTPTCPGPATYPGLPDLPGDLPTLGHLVCDGEATQVPYAAAIAHDTRAQMAGEAEGTAARPVLIAGPGGPVVQTIELLLSNRANATVALDLLTRSSTVTLTSANLRLHLTGDVRCNALPAGERTRWLLRIEGVEC